MMSTSALVAPDALPGKAVVKVMKSKNFSERIGTVTTTSPRQASKISALDGAKTKSFLPG
jgi:hypothetical protein